MKEIVENYEVVSVVKVQWGDMDALQHVNNVVYVRWRNSQD
jgi:acyl-CoA thioester hydrolase